MLQNSLNYRQVIVAKLLYHKNNIFIFTQKIKARLDGVVKKIYNTSRIPF